MRPIAQITATSSAALLFVTTVAGCSGISNPRAAYAAPSCSELVTSAVAYKRSDTGDINSVLQALSDNCSDEYEIAVDYVGHATDSEYSSDSCDELLGFGVRPESVDLLEQDGWCSFGTSDTSPNTKWPEGGLGWDEAAVHVGTVQRVCGPLMSARETNDGTFVNVGADYPSADRFTFIFWDIYLEPIDANATICGSGEIYLYEGVTQMELTDPSALEIWQ